MCRFNITTNILRHKCIVGKTQEFFSSGEILHECIMSCHFMSCVFRLHIIAPKSFIQLCCCCIHWLICNGNIVFSCNDLTECTNNDYNDLFCCCCWFRWVFLLLHRNILRAVNCISRFRESLFTVTASCAAYFVFAALKNRKLTCTRDTKMHVLER